MDDLISRQEALNIRFNDAINEDGVLYVPLRDFTNGLKALPSTQPEDKYGECDAWNQYKNYPRQQWIPCSVRPPEEKDGRVLITLDGEVTTAIYSEFSKTWYIGDMCGVSNRVPTAWMPQPKPYKEGEA